MYLCITLNPYFKTFQDISQPVEISAIYKVHKAPVGCNGFPCPILDKRGKTEATFEVAKSFSYYLSSCSKWKRPNICVELVVYSMWCMIWLILGFTFEKKNYFIIFVVKILEGSSTFPLVTMNNYTTVNVQKFCLREPPLSFWFNFYWNHFYGIDLIFL